MGLHCSISILTKILLRSSFYWPYKGESTFVGFCIIRALLLRAHILVLTYLQFPTKFPFLILIFLHFINTTQEELFSLQVSTVTKC